MLQFDEKRLINDIIKEINIEMDLVAKILVEFMAGEISSAPAHNASFTQWKSDVIGALKWRSLSVAGQLVREVGVLDQSDEMLYKAMAVEFGTGDYMASNSVNPWLQEYLSSEYYHKSRQGVGIYSLPGEEVYNPDEGWHKSNAEKRVALPFLEEYGTYFWTNIFGNSSIMAQTYFDKGIDNAIARIDFSNYLIVK